MNSNTSNEAELVKSEQLSDSVRPNNSKRQAPPPPSNNRTSDTGSATSKFTFLKNSVLTFMPSHPTLRFVFIFYRVV